MKNLTAVSRVLMFTFIFGSDIINISAQKVTLNQENSPLANVFEAISLQTGLTFQYSDQIVDVSRIVSIHTCSARIEDTLNNLFSGMHLHYEIKKNKIFLMEKKPYKNKRTIKKTNAATAKKRLKSNACISSNKHLDHLHTIVIKIPKEAYQIFRNYSPKFSLPGSADFINQINNNKSIFPLCRFYLPINSEKHPGDPGLKIYFPNSWFIKF